MPPTCPGVRIVLSLRPAESVSKWTAYGSFLTAVSRLMFIALSELSINCSKRVVTTLGLLPERCQCPVFGVTCRFVNC